MATVRVTVQAGDELNVNRIVRAIEVGDRINGGNFSGDIGGGAYGGGPKAGPVTYGMLAEEHRESAAAAVYVLYSRVTPIAWITRDGAWVIPDRTYSDSTTRHQTLARKVADLVESRGLIAKVAEVVAMSADGRAPLRTIADIKARNKALGHFFFSTDTTVSD
jgi:hypothetical protein